jgi:TPP-dependent trihydroxycyclohexane-1,2-dione (THcHDO) dehydratase
MSAADPTVRLTVGQAVVRFLAAQHTERDGSGRLPDGERIEVDFVANAASLGCRATLVPDVASLRTALAAARVGSELSVVVVPTDPDRSLLPSGSFWDLGVPMEASEGRPVTVGSERFSVNVIRASLAMLVVKTELSCTLAM